MPGWSSASAIRKGREFRIETSLAVKLVVFIELWYEHCSAIRMSSKRHLTTPFQPIVEASGGRKLSGRARVGRAVGGGLNNTPPRIERIARRAYEIYQSRGGCDGRSLEDWLQAERDIDGD